MALSVKKQTSNRYLKMFDFDPNATTATAVGWVALRDFSSFLVGFFRTIGTSDVTLAIHAATDSSGTNSAVVVSKTVSAQPDAVGDQLYLECLAEQVAQLGSDNGKVYTHVSAVISLATATDEGVALYSLDGARFNYDGLTADIVST